MWLYPTSFLGWSAAAFFTLALVCVVIAGVWVVCVIIKEIYDEMRWRRLTGKRRPDAKFEE